jgi:antitoxin component of MazEF toxin-antitoxin module
MQVSKWGNSLAIRLPASVVEALELHEAGWGRDSGQTGQG